MYDTVDLNSIKHDSNPYSNCRNFLSFVYSDVKEGKEAIVILKNQSKSFVNGIKPSKENFCIDSTTYVVMKTISNFNKNTENKYKKVTILNLFPEFSTDAERINKIYKFKPNESISPSTKCYKRMHKIITKRFARQDCDVIYAWGGDSGIYSKSYDLAIKRMKDHFNSDHAYEFDGTKFVRNVNPYPLHGLAWDKKRDSISTSEEE